MRNPEDSKFFEHPEGAIDAERNEQQKSIFQKIKIYLRRNCSKYHFYGGIVFVIILAVVYFIYSQIHISEIEFTIHDALINAPSPDKLEISLKINEDGIIYTRLTDDEKDDYNMKTEHIDEYLRDFFHDHNYQYRYVTKEEQAKFVFTGVNQNQRYWFYSFGVSSENPGDHTETIKDSSWTTKEEEEESHWYCLWLC